MVHGKALVVVDTQVDFFQIDSLKTKDTTEMIRVINELLPKFETIIFTKDIHKPNSKFFNTSHEYKNEFDLFETNGKFDMLWPEHCIENDRGSDLYEGLNLSRMSGNFYIFKKEENENRHVYSGFDNTELDVFLDEKGIDELFVCGMHLDFAVKETCLDAVKLGFKTNLIINGTCHLFDEEMTDSYIELFENDVKLVESHEINDNIMIKVKGIDNVLKLIEENYEV